MISKLIAHLNELGFQPPIDKIALDGRIHRFNRDGKLNAWLIGFQNHTLKGDPYIVSQFGDWKTGEEYNFTSSVKLSKHDKNAIEKQMKEASERRAIEKLQAQAQAASDAEDFWKTCSDNPSSDYLALKKIKGLYGCKTSMGEEGRSLIVPMRDVDGKLWGYQEIRADRSKKFGYQQKKSGNFHIIPFIEALQDQSTVYIAEGFATAASIHEATGLSVVVAFDSGNLIHVAKALKSKYNDKAFIICGDDDRFNEKNVGRESAEEAAKAVLGKAIFPVFKNPALKLTDFNDLAISDGFETVKNQILEVKPEFNTVSCLGYSDDVYYFISSEKPNVTAISKGSFSKNCLMDLMPLSYWELKFPKLKGLGPDVDAASNALMQGCRTQGKFMPRNVRGAGVWQDQKRTVVNLGDSLWVDGELKEYREFKSKYIYQAADRISAPRHDFADTESMAVLDSLIKKLSWKKSSSPILFLGWLMIAPVCGSLRWRPHIWITGPSGSGKTTVMQDIIGKVFGDSATKIMGRSTEAGIRQSVASDARPLLFDENETTDKKSEGRVASVIELFRQASSETDSHVVKGTISGKSIAFNIRFAAVISSINVGLSLEQDINRFSTLEMYTNKNNGFTEPGGTREQLERLITETFSEKMYSRSVHRLPVILDNFKVFYRLFQKTHSSRFADQYGTLLAGYMAAISDSVVTEIEAQNMIESIDLKEHEDAASVKDENDCEEYLLSSRIQEQGQTFSVGEITRMIQNPEMISDTIPDSVKKPEYLNRVLMHYGLKEKEGFLAVQSKHPELSKLFANSNWPKNWGRTLSRIPGSKQENVKFHGLSVWCTLIPIIKT